MLKKYLTLGTCLCLLTACSVNNANSKNKDTNMSQQKTEKTEKSHEQHAQSNSNDNGLQSVVEGQKAPELKLKDKDGKDVSLADYAGKKIYLNFWASWCEPCKDEMPHLEKVYQKYKNDPNYAFLSVVAPNDAKYGNTSSTDSSEQKILETAKAAGITYPVLYDQNNGALNSYSLRAFPSHVFINSDGTVNKVFAGELNQETLEAGLKALK